MMRRALWLAAGLVVACSTGKPESSADDEAPPGSIVVLEDTMIIKSGAVGVKLRQDATYVFVDVENRTDQDRRVAVDGMLRKAGGEELGPLSVDELRIPQRGRRTFALVYNAVAPDAATVTFRIRGSRALDYPVSVTVTKTDSEQVGNKLVALVRIQNLIDRPVVATLVATFYDDDGKIRGRPFTILEILPKRSRPFRFVGPEGSTRVVAFVGDILQ